MSENWNPGWNSMSIVVNFNPGDVETFQDFTMAFAGGEDRNILRVDNTRICQIYYADIPSGHEILYLQGNIVITPIST